MNNYVTGIDLILIILYVTIILAIGHAFSNKFPFKVIKGYFMKGLALKLLCGLGFAWIYVYYYGGGDTQNYFRGGSVIYNSILSDGFSALFDNNLLRYGSPSTILTQRITGIVNLFSFNSFWSCTLLFAALSFIGQWLLFVSFYRLFPVLHKQLAIATLFIPGVSFWSSGIMKDSVCMLFVGVIVYSIQNIFLFNKKKLISTFLVVTGFIVILNLKAYIAIALLLAIALYALLAVKGRIKNPSFRMLLMPLMAGVIVAVTVLTMSQIGESFKRFSLENITETAQIYQGYHERISYAGRGSEVRTGSGYNLGEINYNNPISVLAKFPLAVNVTFFRPYLWEVKNPVMLLSALESFLILLFTLTIIRRAGIKDFFKKIVTKKEVLFCMSFALIFGFAVGFTTYNFGSLVRYKTPCIPFFLISLILINEHHFSLKNLKKASRLRRTTVMGRHKTPSRIVPS